MIKSESSIDASGSDAVPLVDVLTPAAKACISPKTGAGVLLFALISLRIHKT